jgi:hypothetical protein
MNEMSRLQRSGPDSNIASRMIHIAESKEVVAGEETRLVRGDKGGLRVRRLTG